MASSADPRPNAADERAFYSISDAAALLGVSRVSVWRWIRAGQIPVARLGHRTSRIRREDIERMLSANGVAAQAPRPDWRDLAAAEHFAQFYEADRYLIDAVSDFIGTALREGNAGVVVATPRHREALADQLLAQGVDLGTSAAEDRYIALDAAETLATFMADGTPDPQRFADVIGTLVRRATQDQRRVRVFGEMVALLASEGNHQGAIRLEELWNNLQRTQAFSLFCGYQMADFGHEGLGAALASVCAEHGRVVPGESYLSLDTPDARLRAIALLQQKAESLEAALKSERKARADAEAAMRLRDEFLSIASHELKTPLTALKAYADLNLRRFNRDGEVGPGHIKQALETITTQAEKLGSLLNQLLDISRIETGKLSIERGRIDLSRLVGDVVAQAGARASQHHIRLTAPARLEVDVDGLRLEQVLINLLDNAIKYSPDGGAIDVVLDCIGPRAVELSVRDHGLGIPPDKRAQIFERFYQAHGTTKASGMGLGLYISRQIVELHGGRIRAEFPSDGGTRFVVWLPAVDVDDEPADDALTFATD